MIPTNLAKIMPNNDIKTPIHAIPTAVPGFANLSPALQVVFSKWKETLKQIYELHGFNPLDLPIFAHRKFLLKEGNIAPQIFSVNKLPDNEMTPWGIAFDHTVPFALWVKEWLNDLPMPYKRYDISVSYRDESTKPGRFCGFYQADVDIVGKNLSLTCDVECITTLVKALLELKVPQFEVLLNHIQIPKALIDNLGVKNKEEVLRLIDKLDKETPSKIIDDIAALETHIKKEDISKLVEICSFRGSVNDFPYRDRLDATTQKYLDEMIKATELLNQSCKDGSLFVFAPGTVRGLAYYTGIVFETFMKGERSRFGSIMSGGRYDKLVDAFTETPTGIQGVGGSIGLSRIFDVLHREGLIPATVKTAAKVFVLMQNESVLNQAVAMAKTLREKRISTDVYSGTGTLRHQLDYANNYGISTVVIVRREGDFTIRNLTKGQQSNVITRMVEVASKVEDVLTQQAKGKLIHTRNKAGNVDIGSSRVFTPDDFFDTVYGKKKIVLADDAKARLDETRGFIDHLLENNIKVYGLTTGFADLRNVAVSPADAQQLSKNIISSHDAGIGASLSPELVKGAMILRANSLSKGNSGFQTASLNTLIEMINNDIIPEIPKFGSLGASGDLAPLARLGRAMQGDDVPVRYEGKTMMAGEALKRAGIAPFVPGAKEGLALTNGTSFMASMLMTAYLRQLHIYENVFSLISLYLNATNAVDAAFSGSIQEVRDQWGQSFTAEIFRNLFEGSPLIDREGVQNDYSQRCLPQILGAKIEAFFGVKNVVFKEIDFVTDNPLVFKKKEISPDVGSSRRILFNDEEWSVLSGGNFHGEPLATAADTLRQINAKIALTLERHLTFLNNRDRNKQFTPYLIADSTNVGLLSGFMIPQYTANGVTQTICALSNPVSNFNLTSANESEDIVSYGFASSLQLLEQLKDMEHLMVIYATSVAQAYSLKRTMYQQENGKELDKDLLSEKLFAHLANSYEFPIRGDKAFDKAYEAMRKLLSSDTLRKEIDYPLTSHLGLSANTL